MFFVRNFLKRKLNVASHIVGGKAAAHSTFKNFYRVFRVDISVHALPRTAIEGIKGNACEQTEWYCRKSSGATETLKSPQILFRMEQRRLFVNGNRHRKTRTRNAPASVKNFY